MVLPRPETDWFDSLDPGRSAPDTVHLVRAGLYQALGAELRRRAPVGRGIAVADWAPVLPSLTPNVETRLLRWPEHDLQVLGGIPDNAVDVVFSDMVLEHVEQPGKVVEACHRVLKPGGLAVHTTVFAMPYHPCPDDLWRFSAPGLERLFARFDQVTTGTVGGRRLWGAALARLTRIPVPRGWLTRAPRGLFASEDSRFGLCTWVIAQK